MTELEGNLASSVLSGYSYDTDTKVLTLTFSSGRTYDYYDVPQDVVEGLMQSNSKGHYFNAMIKGVYG